MSKYSMKQTGLIVGAATLLSAASVAVAGDMPSYGDLDANSDGTITKQEADANEKLSENFDQYDTNADGALGYGEFARFEAEGKSMSSGEGEEATTDDGGFLP